MYIAVNIPKITILLILVLSSFCVRASTWRAISATNTYTDGSVSEYSFGGSFFSDGQFNSSEYDQILVNSSGDGSFSFNDWSVYSSAYSYMNAPQVDITNMHVDFSSLIFTGWESTGTPVIGYEVGSPTWVPIVDNGDNTYTATWITPVPLNSADPGGSTLSITFAPVPLPASLLLFMSGFIVLIFNAKFKLKGD